MHLLQVLILIIKNTPTPTLTPTLALVVQSKSTHSQKPKLSTSSMGDHYVLGFSAHPELFPGSNSLKTTKVLQMRLNQRSPFVYIHMCEKFTYIICLKNTLKLRYWKQPNNPECTKSVSLQNVEDGHYMKEEEKLSWLTGCKKTHN